MAVSSPAATLYVSRSNYLPLTLKTSTLSLNSIYFKSKPLKLNIRSSGDLSAETTTATETATETDDSESSIEAPTEPPSLISTLNVERALRGIPITDVDHYGTLGIQRGCPYDQVPVAYKSKVEELTNQGLEEDELNEKLELLKESYRILSSVEERRLYDWSLGRSEKPEKYVWPFETDITQTNTQSPPPKEPEDEGPTRLVGYFLLGWFILSIILSIAFNR